MKSNKNEKRMKKDLQEKKLHNTHRSAFIANAKRVTLSIMSKRITKLVNTYGNTMDKDGKRIKMSEMLHITKDKK